MVRLLQLLQSWKLKSPSRQLVLLGGNVSVGCFSQVMLQGRLFAYQLIASPITDQHMGRCWGELMKRFLLHSYSNAIHDIGYGFCFQHLKVINARNYGSIRIIWESNQEERNQQAPTTNTGHSQQVGLARTGLEVEQFTTMQVAAIRPPRIRLCLIVQE